MIKLWLWCFPTRLYANMNPAPTECFLAAFQIRSVWEVNNRVFQYWQENSYSSFLVLAFPPFLRDWLLPASLQTQLSLTESRCPAILGSAALPLPHLGFGPTPQPLVIKPSRTRELIRRRRSGCAAKWNCTALKKKKRSAGLLWSCWDKNNRSYPQITSHINNPAPPLPTPPFHTGFADP